MIRVAVSGTGLMGQVVLSAAGAEENMEVVGVLAPHGAPGSYEAANGSVYPQYTDPVELFDEVRVDVVVDFTHASFTDELVKAALASDVRLVIGTSGIYPETIERLRHGCAEQNLGAVVAPNFATGAIALIHQARMLARQFDYVQIIECHREGKADAPSGTALEIARQMREARGRDFERALSASGFEYGGIRVSSMRMPGLAARHEVILSGNGQRYTLVHESLDRTSFMPGVLLAVQEVMERSELASFEEILGFAK